MCETLGGERLNTHTQGAFTLCGNRSWLGDSVFDRGSEELRSRSKKKNLKRKREDIKAVLRAQM